MQPAPKAGIFISYRREEAGGDAGRLADDLQERFGPGKIFRDIDNIEPGLDFVEAINQAVGSCAVLLAVIGPHWLTVTDERGRRRLDDPNDFVVLEIEAALSRNVRVIPVLVRDAKMPSAEQLPRSLAKLAQRQAHTLADRSWKTDIAALVTTLEKIVTPDKPWPKPAAGHGFWTRKRVAWAAAGVAVAAVLAIVAALIEDSAAPAPWPTPAFAPTSPLPVQQVLYCCDVWGNRRCPMGVVLPVGSPCFCPYVQGQGAVCR